MADTTRDAKLEGSWEQVKGRVQEAWGALTDDDVERSRGNRERLVGVVRERTGESLEKVENTLSDLLDKAQEAGEPSEE